MLQRDSACTVQRVHLHDLDRCRELMFQTHHTHVILHTCLGESKWLTLLLACTLKPHCCHLALQTLSYNPHQFACFHFFYTPSPPFSQGVPVELLCRPTSAGFDLDVCSARHDRQALHPLSDPLCCLWLTAGFCHCDGALYPTARGRGWF